MKQICLTMLLLAAFNFLYAQTVIKGKVFDALSKEPLQNATISDRYNNVVKVDGSGKFKISTNDYSLVFTYVGYETKIISIKNGDDIQVSLKPDTRNLEQVIVSASRTAQKRSEAPVAIATLSSQTLEDTKATRLDELLNKVSGINMVNLGNEQHEMSIRQPMTTKSLYLYLEDGIPIRTTGLYNHNALLEMNMTAAKQIEIIKGSASSLYGAEAIGGAVNIITQAPPAVFNGRVSIQANNNGYKRVDARAGKTFGKLGLLVSGYYASRRNGPVDHSDFDKKAVTVRADYNFSDRTKWVNDITYVDYISDMRGTLDSIHFARKDYSTQQTFTYRKVPALRYKSQVFHEWNSNSSTQASFVYRDNSVEQNPSYRIKNVAGDPKLAHGEINESAFNTYMLIVQHQQKFKWMNSKLIAGLTFDGSPSRYYSNYIRIQRNDNGDYISYAETDSVLSKYKTGISNLASYLHYETTPVKGLKVTAALRYDYYDYNFINSLPPSAFTGAPSTRNTFKRFSPKIGATYNYKNAGLYANYSEGFVPPQISELYTGVKVPYIGSQTFFNYETGGWFSLLQKKIYVDWSLYLLNGSNEIISVRNPDGSLENRNAGKTKHTGIEYGITYKPSTQLSARFSGTNSKHTFVRYLEKDINYDGKKIPAGPGFIANAEVMYKPAFLKGFRIGAEWQHIGDYFMDNANSTKYAGYDLLNIRTGYVISHFEIWMNVMNATNKYYSTLATKSGSTISYNPGEPREFNVGIAYRFGKNE